jgi:uncharacterized protein (DUF983 family)
MSRFSEQLRRGFALRCPVCGRGKLFRKWTKMYAKCPICNTTYEREEGYFSSAMAIDLVISELIVAALVIPLAANTSIPTLPVLLLGSPLPFILPILLYWHSRSLWMCMDQYMNPRQGYGLPTQPSLTYRPDDEH